jgi:Fe-S oxidoreductase
MWKEEEAGEGRVSVNRMQEVLAANASSLAVGCPFCLVMLEDAAKETGTTVPVVDLAEAVLEQLES